MQKAQNMGETVVTRNRIHLWELFSHDGKKATWVSGGKEVTASTGDSLQDAFPAVLLIALDNKVQLFKTTAEAQRFVEMIKDKT